MPLRFRSIQMSLTVWLPTNSSLFQPFRGTFEMTLSLRHRQNLVVGRNLVIGRKLVPRALSTVPITVERGFERALRTSLHQASFLWANCWLPSQPFFGLDTHSFPTNQRTSAEKARGMSFGFQYIYLIRCFGVCSIAVYFYALCCGAKHLCLGVS